MHKLYSTKLGRKELLRMPHVAHQVGMVGVDALLRQNTKATIQKCGDKHSATLVESATRGMKTQEAAELTGKTKRYIQKCRKSARERDMNSHSSALTTDRSVRNPVGVRFTTQEEQAIYVDFFRRNTHQRSGARGETRELQMRNVEIEAELFAQYPSLLRSFAQNNPDVLSKARQNKNPTRFEWSLVNAVNVESEYVGDWNKREQEEINVRRNQYLTKYRHYLARKRAEITADSMDYCMPKETDDRFNYAKPIQPNLFWAILKDIHTIVLFMTMDLFGRAGMSVH